LPATSKEIGQVDLGVQDAGRGKLGDHVSRHIGNHGNRSANDGRIERRVDGQFRTVTVSWWRQSRAVIMLYRANRASRIAPRGTY
jgi:hypothetical protein